MKAWGKPVPGLPNITVVGPEIVLTAYHNGAIPAPIPIVRYAPPPTYEQTEEIRAEEGKAKTQKISTTQKKQVATQTAAPAVAKRAVGEAAAIKSIKSLAIKSRGTEQAAVVTAQDVAIAYAKANQRLQSSASTGEAARATPKTMVSKPVAPPKVVIPKIKVYNLYTAQDLTISENEFDGSRHLRWPPGWERPEGKFIVLTTIIAPYDKVFIPKKWKAAAWGNQNDLHAWVDQVVDYFGGERALYLSWIG